MDEVAAITGRSYSLFDYVGHPEAENVIVMMGSGASTTQEVADSLNSEGEKYGVLKVRLFRPWDLESFMAALPESTKNVCVLDRTREDGALGNPLHLDVGLSFQMKKSPIKLVGGQYGLASKEFTPAQVRE